MFRLRGVPHFVHGGRSFAERPLSKAILALTGLQPNSFSREAVLEAMELTAAALPEDALSGWDVQGWRALTNDPRFLAGIDSWDSGTEALAEKARMELARAEAHPEEDVDLESGAGIRSVWVLRKRLESAMCLREMWRLIKEAADWPAYLSWPAWAALIEERLEPLMGKSADWFLFSSVLDEIGSLDSLGEFEIGEGVPVHRLRSALIEGISSRSCPVGRFQRSGVNLLSTSAARGLRFPLVIIPGLDEGRFPARLRQDPLLLDAERSFFKALSIKSRRIEEEKLLFDMAARSAGKRLVLMTSRLDETSDREQIPSQFFLRVASAVCGRSVAMRDLTEGTIAGFHSVSLDNPAPAKNEIPVDEGEIRLRLVTAGSDSAVQAIQMLAALEPLRLSRPHQYDKARWARKLTPFDGYIADPPLVRWTAQKLSASAGQVSASRIEEYVKCPYYFFLKRVMDLRAWEEQGKIEGMDPLDRGLVIHSILEKFLRDSGECVFQSTGERLEKQLEDLARESLEAARPAGIADLLWEIERDALIRMLNGWVKFEKARAESGMRVARLEQVFGEFGPEEKLPAFRLKAGRHTFDFRGRIDRIDFSVDRKRARVVDYKTGALPESMANKNSRTPLMSGERIQIVVYAGALSVLEGFDGVETLEGEYLHLHPRNGLTVSCSFTHEELQKASRELADILGIVGDGIESGTFFARTSGKIRPSGHCDYCDFLPICGKDRVQREERKAKDPVVRKFLETTEPV
jgi:RecB family exonuclease